MAIDDADLNAAGALPADPSEGAVPMFATHDAAHVTSLGPLDIDALVASVDAGGYPVAFADEVKTAAARLDRASPDYHRLRIALRPILAAQGVMRDWDQAVDVLRTQLRAAAQDKSAVADASSAGAVASKFAVKNGRICLVKEHEGGMTSTPLCNFNARIIEEILFDDGTEETRHLVIAGRLATGGTLPRTTVPAAEFKRISDWTVARWGTAPVVGGAPGTELVLREALQIISQPKLRRVYRHTGWRRVDDQWTYLTNAGSIGAPAEVQLDGALARFRLPPERSSPSATVDAINASLSILRVAPIAITGPILAAVGLAPLSSFVTPDFTVWLQGRSGSFKSELAALAQSHWGAFPRVDLPDSWMSTANAIEASLFAAKDAVFVIDDYAPQASQREQAILERLASTVLRAVGNRQSRGRLRHDLTRRPDRPARGVVMTTAEISPPSGSVASRVLVVTMDRSNISIPELTRIQAITDVFPIAMRAYIEWLAPQLDAIAATGKGELAALRHTYSTAAPSHARSPDTLAKLHFGLATYLRFAVACGAKPQVFADEVLVALSTALSTLSAHQSAAAQDDLPGVRFIRVISALLTQGRIALQPALSADLSSFEYDSSGNQRTLTFEYVGWLDAETQTAHLDPELSLRAVSRFLRDSGEHWPVTSVRALGEVLVDAKVIQRSIDGKSTRKIRGVGPNGRGRVWSIDFAKIHGSDVGNTSPTGDLAL